MNPMDPKSGGSRAAPLMASAEMASADNGSAPMPLTEMLLAAAGGALGALCRWQLSPLLGDGFGAASAATSGGTTPGSLAFVFAATLAINWMGCFMLGALLPALEGRQWSPWLRPFLAVGFLGAFTTYSAFAMQALAFAQQLGALLAAAMAALAIAGGVLFYFAGHQVSHAYFHSGKARPETRRAR